MPVPQVVIVGRPNVGKSSLLNWLAGRRISIVDDQAGVTRDRVTYLMEAGARFFELVDTGGIGIEDSDNLTKEVEAQIEAGLESADVVLFVVDTRTGLVPLDEEVARRLRYIDKPIILVANKADNNRREDDVWQFLSLGLGDAVPVSALHGRRAGDLLDVVLERLGDKAIPFRLLKKVMATCTDAAYERISLAVVQKEDKVSAHRTAST